MEESTPNPHAPPQSPPTKSNKRMRDFFRKKFFSSSIIIPSVFLLSLIIPITIAYMLAGEQNNELPNRETVCSNDKFACPNGSIVKRIGQSCEFAPCPIFVTISKPDKENFITYTDTNLKFRIKYPADKLVSLAEVCQKDDENYEYFSLYARTEWVINSVLLDSCNGFTPTALSSITIKPKPILEPKDGWNVSSEEITIDGKKYTKTIADPIPPDEGIFISTKNTVIPITNRGETIFLGLEEDLFPPTEIRPNIPEETFYQIVSSFEILQPSPVIGTPQP